MTINGDDKMTAARPLALVTGASSGIGEAFADRLARDGYDLVLVARRKERLQALADRLREDSDVAVEVLCADLTDTGDLKRVEEKIGAADRLECLVNNAGFMTPRHFADARIEEWDAMVRLHVLATVRLTHAALPGMISRGRGDVINVASVAAFAPMPSNVTYSATKAFLDAFTEGLVHELRGTGVRMQCLCPGWTRTELLDVEGVDTSGISEAWWLRPEYVVDYSLKSLRRGKVTCVPGWRYRAMVTVCRMVPRPVLRLLVRLQKSKQVSTTKE